MRSKTRAAKFGTIMAVLLTMMAAGCRSHRATAGKPDAENQSRSAGNPTSPQLDGKSYCVQTITEGPPPARPIHFSYKMSSTDATSKDYEADLVGDRLDLTIRSRHAASDLDLNRPVGAKPGAIAGGLADSVETDHYKRSEARDWAIAAIRMARGATPWRLFGAKPAEMEVGRENIIGYRTVKYALDTTSQSEREKASSISEYHPKDYNIAGFVWVDPRSGCILQYSIDFEKWNEDGTRSRTHYLGTVTRQ